MFFAKYNYTTQPTLNSNKDNKLRSIQTICSAPSLLLSTRLLFYLDNLFEICETKKNIRLLGI